MDAATKTFNASLDIFLENANTISTRLLDDKVDDMLILRSFAAVYKFAFDAGYDLNSPLGKSQWSDVKDDLFDALDGQSSDQLPFLEIYQFSELLGS